MHPIRWNAPILNTVRDINLTPPVQCAVSSPQIQTFQIMQVNNVADEQPSTSLGLQKTSAQLKSESQSQQENFPFKAKRDFVPDTFWDSLLEELPQEQFYQNYNEFLLTNWNCTQKQRDNLIKIRKNARTAKNKYNALVQSNFQYDLRVSAFKLMHSILGIGRYHTRLKNAPEPEIKKTKSSRDNALKNINESYTLAFDKYLNYLNQRDENKPTMEQIESLDMTIIKTRRNYLNYNKFSISQNVILDVDEIPNNLNFINSVLNKIKNGKHLTLDIATELAKEYKPYKKPSIPADISLGKHANESPQDSEEPYQKRKLTQLEQLLLDTNKVEMKQNTKNINTLKQSSEIKSTTLQFTHSEAVMSAYDQITTQTSPLNFKVTL